MGFMGGTNARKTIRVCGSPIASPTSDQNIETNRAVERSPHCGRFRSPASGSPAGVDASAVLGSGLMGSSAGAWSRLDGFQCGAVGLGADPSAMSTSGWMRSSAGADGCV
jgi:hypothetical protein